MRLFRVDGKGEKVSEIKTFDGLKGKYDAIQTAIDSDIEGGKYLLEETPGQYYEFDVNDKAVPVFLPGNEGLHEGAPEKHLARIQHNPDTLSDKKSKYGDFLLDTPGAAPEENPFAPQPAAIEPETTEEGTREELDPNAPEETPESEPSSEDESGGIENEGIEGIEGIEDTEDAAVAEAEAEGEQPDGSEAEEPAEGEEEGDAAEGGDADGGDGGGGGISE